MDETEVDYKIYIHETKLTICRRVLRRLNTYAIYSDELTIRINDFRHVAKDLNSNVAILSSLLSKYSE